MPLNRTVPTPNQLIFRNRRRPIISPGRVFVAMNVSSWLAGHLFKLLTSTKLRKMSNSPAVQPRIEFWLVAVIVNLLAAV